MCCGALSGEIDASISPDRSGEFAVLFRLSIVMIPRGWKCP